MDGAVARIAEPTGAEAVARRFVEARRSATALPAYPGEAPADMASAYAIQDAAIALWPDRVAGWKVGRIAAPVVDRFGAERLAGPIFAQHVWPTTVGGEQAFPVIPGGFAAVEAEFVFRLGEDAPAGKTAWTFAEVEALEGELHIGVEIAASPLRTINELGPAVVASDFGNNRGLFLGPAIADWRARLSTLLVETTIEGRSVGRGGATSIPGSPLEAVRFLLEHCARRGRSLVAGDLVSTGAATGIHDIEIGQSARATFGFDGMIDCRAVQAAA